MNSFQTETWLNTQPKLKAFIYSKVKDKALAEDIVQDVFLKVYTQIENVRESDKLTGWIYQVTKNAITDHFRKQARTIKHEDLSWENEPANFNECVASCLIDMLNYLPEKYREAIELTELENLSQTQLAERLQISYSGAKSRVQRAREMVKENLLRRYHIRLDGYGNAVECRSCESC